MCALSPSCREQRTPTLRGLSWQWPHAGPGPRPAPERAAGSLVLGFVAGWRAGPQPSPGLQGRWALRGLRPEGVAQCSCTLRSSSTRASGVMKGALLPCSVELGVGFLRVKWHTMCSLLYKSSEKNLDILESGWQVCRVHYTMFSSLSVGHLQF